MEINIIKSKRKTIGIIVKSNEVVIRAPHYLSDKEINIELKEHKAWIDKKILEQERKNEIGNIYSRNGIFLFKGKDLKVVKTEGKKVIVNEDNIYIGENSNIDLFLKREMSSLTDILKFKWKDINIPTSISYRKQKTIWGSCTIKGRINLNINLIKAPQDVIEYIYIHELVHLEIRNHSKSFWLRVENLLPDYKQSKRWLKDNGHLIGRDFMIK